MGRKQHAGVPAAIWILLPVLLAVLLLVAAYGNTFQVPFVFDDMSNIVENNALRIEKISPAALLQAVHSGPSVNRLLPNLSFVGNFYVGGPDVFGFHLVNLLVHLAATLVFYQLAAATLALPVFGDRYGRRGREIALLAALLWAVHPLQTNAVTYIVQRMTSMAALFFLAAMLCYLRGRLSRSARRRWAWFAGALLSGGCALVSKENAAMLPVMVLAYEFFFLREGEGRPDWRRFAVGAGLALLLVVVAGLFFMGGDGFSALVNGYQIRNFTLAERLLTEPRVIFFYLSLLAWPLPSRLSLNHDVVISRHLFAPPQTALALLGLVALAGLAVVLFRRHRLASFAIVWFLGNLVIESSVIPLELIFEHRLYLPSTFLLLAVVAAVWQLPRPASRTVARLLLALAICCCVLFTRQRNEVWSDSVSLWTDVVRKAPDLVRGYVNLGRAYLRAGDYGQAEATLRAGLAQDARNRAAGRGGAPVSAIATLHENLGVAYWRLGDLARAGAETDMALFLNPDLIEALITKGILYEARGESTRAVVQFGRARALGGDTADLYLNWAVSSFSLGEVEQAIRFLSRVVELEPDNAEAHYNLGIAYGTKGMAAEAQREMSLGMQLRRQQGGGR